MSFSMIVFHDGISNLCNWLNVKDICSLMCTSKASNQFDKETFWKAQAERVFHTYLSASPKGSWKLWVLHPSSYYAGPWDLIDFEKRKIVSDDIVAKLDKLSKFIQGKLIFETCMGNGSRRAIFFRESVVEGPILAIPDLSESNHESDETANRFKKLKDDPNVCPWSIYNYDPLVM